MAYNDLSATEKWAGALLEKVGASARSALARKLGTELRRRQQQRIRAQQNPDGSAFAPRKLRDQKGAIRRRAMFTRLSTARFLRVRSTPEGVAIGFFGRVARIAKVHHYGELDQVAPKGARIQYPSRRLLGFSNTDRAFIRDELLRHLGGNS